MKKTVIWILLAIMGITFVGLVFIQFRYILQMSSLMEEQYDTNVKRSLYQVALDLEEAEAAKYLNQELGAAEIAKLGKLTTEALLDSTQKGVLEKIDTASFRSKPSVSISTPASSIQETSRVTQNLLAQAFTQSRKLVEVVAWRRMKEAAAKEIAQRVNIDELTGMIHDEFANNEVASPYRFKLIDRKGNVVYNSASDSDSGDHRYEYTQKLFPNDKVSGQSPYLTVNFTSKKNMFRNSLALLLPWAILSLILLLSCIVSILLIFKQRRLNEIKNDFVSNMTHELKTPVSTISLAAQMLADPAVSKTADTMKYYTRVIVDETKRLSFHIEKVLQMSTFERGKGNLKMTERDINDLLNVILENFWVKVHAKHGQLIADLQADESIALVDETHFTNVLYNLMDNAVKYTPSNLVLTVKTWNEKGNLCISIQDNGVGIKKEYQKHIFDKFFRVPTGNVHNVKGFGLGLAYVKQIVDAHHGLIKVESELNIGTKFIISLPTLKQN
jgi:two-component system, OmpR family, phosphate regulon sensor histidine kinase PhoR